MPTPSAQKALAPKKKAPAKAARPRPAAKPAAKAVPKAAPKPKLACARATFMRASKN